MAAQPTTPDAYLASLPDDRREALEAVRATILANLDPKFEEGIQYGMIGYYLPHSEYPAGYHCDPRQPLPFASIASQKNHMALYLFCVHTNPAESERFVEEWRKTGKKLDMGKGCVRFKKLEDVPLKVLGATIKRAKASRFVQSYESSLEGTAAGKKHQARKEKLEAEGPGRAESRDGSARGTSAAKGAKKMVKKLPKKTAKKAAKRSAVKPSPAAKKATKKSTKKTSKKTSK